MKNFLRFILILSGSIILFIIPALGWIKLWESILFGIFPSDPTSIPTWVHTTCVIVGLIGLLMPYYTLLYFHTTKHPEVLGYETPHAKLIKQKIEQAG